MRAAIPVIIVASALTLAACGSASESTSSSENADAKTTATSGEFPVTVDHAFGSTTIDSQPQRLATVGWANNEVPLSLDVVPVGMSKATFGDDDGDGILPWVEEKLEELGGDTPVLFDETDSIPFEQIADTQPDVILAAYSGITQDDYDKLSKIAPVVAYPGIPWGTSLGEMITLDAAGLGMEDQGTELNTTLDTEVADTLKQFPDLKEAKVLFTAFGGQNDYSKIGFYGTKDPRAGFLADAGIGVPQVVQDESGQAESFWIERSAEDVEAFNDVTLIISYGSDDPAENAKTLAELQAHPLLGRIPAIRDGHVAFLGNGPLAASANPSPLSIPWGIQDYFSLLNDTLK
ncbi:putative siderophore-binding lipoprotein YfiY precursor [Corynebacterium atrinae]|uniref:iron-siderophore ABC transporter substrate-binding protein n=1 Tax=Corynebacterium atrinae TaxID=1336740 RepID=UPI0025B481F8|nr:iron-siderophore ABC transporter substrate-binding protein [Corynebacterium atrinae]WJY62620.1 putative siderophore-binding lipoprotein YfiY precursor [Corynebacterium atrinae]